MSENGELDRWLAILRATLDAASDGILVVGEDGRILRYNRRFVEMWGLPDSVVLSGDSGEALTFALGQLKDPGRFVTRTMELYAEPGLENLHRLELKDGRVFERYSPPLPAGA